MLIALSSLIVALIVFMVAWYLIFGEKAGQKQGLMHRVVRYVPAQSVKIIIIAWQIITQVRVRKDLGEHTLQAVA